MPEVSCWGCAAQSAVASPWPAILQPLPEETLTSLTVSCKSQRKLTLCHNVISVRLFSRQFPYACRGYGSIVAQLRSMRESQLRDGGPRHSEPQIVLW